MVIQWYPGHMTKAKRMMQEDLKLIDVIVELLDSRVPICSKNPDIDTLANGKSRVIVFNKSDLADAKATQAWKNYYEEKGFLVAIVNSKSGNGIKTITEIIRTACKEKIERDRRRGIINRPVRAMIVGIPNVGKSTFINSYAKKACTKTGNKPGVTKGKQWIRLNKDVELLDTPGILWPKFENQEVGIRLALIGSIKDEILNVEELALKLISKLMELYPSLISEIFKVDENYTPRDDMSLELSLLYEFSNIRGCIAKGAIIDTVKGATILLDDFRNGRFGHITLDQVNENI